ncbi:hypothetical protein TFLX_04890 [Thermoflexales bacterium]|nr:hypothetical protein TFLX_04890 [Thermoflexales bacterium]
MNLFHLLIIPVLLYLIWISWGSLPRLIFALDPSRLRYQFVDMSDEEPAATTVNRFSEIVGQLQQLGFRRLGLKTEKLPLWSSTIYEISLASPDHHAFASLIKDPKRCVYYFYTPFTNGAILLTAGSGAAFPAIQREDCVQQVSVYDSPELVLAAHQEQLQHFTATGLVPCSSYTQESRLDATRQYYAAPAIRRIARQRGIFELVALLFPISLIVILAFLGSRG